MLTQRTGRDAFLFVVGRVEALQITGYAIQVGLSLRQSHTGLEPGEYAQGMCPALPFRRWRSEGPRRPQVKSISRLKVRSLTHERELAREHADNRVAGVVQR